MTSFKKGHYKIILPDNIEQNYAIQRVLFKRGCKWIHSGKELVAGVKQVIISNGIISMAYNTHSFNACDFKYIPWRELLLTKTEDYEIY